MYYVYVEIPKAPTRRTVIDSGGFDAFRVKDDPFVVAKIADAVRAAQTDFARSELAKATRVFATHIDDHEAEEFDLPIDLFISRWKD